MGIADIIGSFGGHQNEPNLGTILNSFGGHQAGGGTTPAPSFSVQPSISPSSGAVGQTFTGNDGTINNGTVSLRQWLLNGSPISGATSATYTSAAAGTLAYQVTATGAGGSATATSAGASVTVSVTLNALTPSTSFQIGTAVSGTLSGATSGSTIACNIPGVTVNSSARTYSGTPTGSAATIANGFVETLSGATNSPKSTSVTVSAAAATLTGFYMNGSTNPKVKTLYTNGGNVVVKGDSTSVGEGGGTAITGPAGGTYYLGNARPNRPTAVLASLLTNAGFAAYDNAVVADNGINLTGASAGNLPQYDARVGGSISTRTDDSGHWQQPSNQPYAGGGFLGMDTSTLTFAPAGNVDTFETLFYNTAVLTLTGKIDGGAPASGASVTSSGSGTGMVKLTTKASSAGMHTVGLAQSGAGSGVARSIRAYNAAAPGIQFIVHASRGATSANQASSDGNWQNLEQIAVDTPSLTMINLGINDAVTGATTASYTTNIQTLVNAGKAQGDVLVIFPHPFQNGSVTNATIQALNDAAKGVASSSGVAFFSLWEYYGSAQSTAVSNRTVDGIHPKAEFYAEIAGLEKQALDLMRAA